MRVIDTPEVIADLTTIIAEHPDGYGYEQHYFEVTGTEYHHGLSAKYVLRAKGGGFQAGCLIGEYLSRLGVPLPHWESIQNQLPFTSLLLPVNRKTDGTQYLAAEPGIGFTEAAIKFIAAVQFGQDRLDSWADALAHAESRAARGVPA